MEVCGDASNRFEELTYRKKRCETARVAVFLIRGSGWGLMNQTAVGDSDHCSKPGDFIFLVECGDAETCKGKGRNFIFKKAVVEIAGRLNTNSNRPPVQEPYSVHVFLCTVLSVYTS